MSSETETGSPCPRCGYTIFVPEDASVTCSECGLVIEPGFSGRNLLRYADPEWLVHLQRGLRASRVLPRILILLIGIMIAMVVVGLALIPSGEDSPLELLFNRIIPFLQWGIILTLFGMPLNVWWLTQLEPVSVVVEDYSKLRILSLLFLPLVGAALGFASPRTGFNPPGMTIMVLYLVAIFVLWCHAMLMRQHIHALLVRCPPDPRNPKNTQSPCYPFRGDGSTDPRLPNHRNNLLRWVIPILTILYVLGPLRWGTTGSWTPPDKGISKLLLVLTTLAWFRVYFEYGKFCLKAVKREMEIDTKSGEAGQAQKDP